MLISTSLLVQCSGAWPPWLFILPYPSEDLRHNGNWRFIMYRKFWSLVWPPTSSLSYLLLQLLSDVHCNFLFSIFPKLWFIFSISRRFPQVHRPSIHSFFRPMWLAGTLFSCLAQLLYFYFGKVIYSALSCFVFPQNLLFHLRFWSFFHLSNIKIGLFLASFKQLDHSTFLCLVFMLSCLLSPSHSW